MLLFLVMSKSPEGTFDLNRNTFSRERVGGQKHMVRAMMWHPDGDAGAPTSRLMICLLMIMTTAL